MSKKLLFDAEPKLEVQEFNSAGFNEKVYGVIYHNAEAKCGVPLGGLGTGYIELLPDGKFGKSSISIFNTWPNLQEINQNFLDVKINNGSSINLSLEEKSNNVKDILYWGHFPVADLIFKTKLPLDISMRAFSTFVLKDSFLSNIPTAIFELNVNNKDKVKNLLSFSFSFPNPKLPKGYKGFEIKAIKELRMKGVEVKNKTWGGYSLVSIPDKDIKINYKTDESKAELSVSFQLNKNEEKKFCFILAWFYPIFKDTDGKVRVQNYSFKFNSSIEVASYVVNNLEILKNKTFEWQEKIYKNKDYPIWLKDALVNGLYSLAKNTWWVNSCEKDSWYLKEGLFTHSESFTGCAITETMVCRFHGHFPILFFFPELEKTTLYAFAHYQLGTGEIPFSFGHSAGLDKPHYQCQHPLNSQQFVQLVYRYYLVTKDKTFLKKLYPNIKKAIEFCITLDIDKDGLINEFPHPVQGENWPANQFYDIWSWYGTSSYVAGTWLATLKVAETIGYLMKDKKFNLLCKRLFKKGMKSFEKKLWNGKYYRLYNDLKGKRKSEICLANQLMGQFCAYISGLGNIFPENRIKSIIASVEKLNMKASISGASNGCNPDGSRDFTKIYKEGNTHASEVFVGENLCFAAMCSYFGRKDLCLEITKRIYDSIAIKSKTLWNWHCLISAETGEPVWGSDYYSDLIIWIISIALNQHTLGTGSPYK